MKRLQKVIVAIITMGLLTTGVNATTAETEAAALLKGTVVHAKIGIEDKVQVKGNVYEAALKSVYGNVNVAATQMAKLAVISEGYKGIAQEAYIKSIASNIETMIGSMKSITGSLNISSFVVDSLTERMNKVDGYLGLNNIRSSRISVSDIQDAEKSGSNTIVVEYRPKKVLTADGYIEVPNKQEVTFVKGLLKEKSNKRERYYLLSVEGLDGSSDSAIIRNEDGDSVNIVRWESGKFTNLVGRYHYYNVEDSVIDKTLGKNVNDAFKLRNAKKYAHLAHGKFLTKKATKIYNANMKMINSQAFKDFLAAQEKTEK